MKHLLILLLFAGFASAQAPQPPPAQPRPQAPPPGPSDEDRQLSQAVGEAGNSPIDLTRALERHLAKYPDSARRLDIERAILRAAIEIKDERRIVDYGERLLAREPDDLQVLDQVMRALLVTDAKDTSERALKYAKHYEELLILNRSQAATPHMSAVQWQDEIDKGIGRALACEARATGNLGRIDDAIALARRSYERYPTAESAREIGRWLYRAGKTEEAITHYADAFAIPDPRNTDSDRAHDRSQAGEMYRKLHGNEQGLGDVILQAYDRTSGLLGARRLMLRQNDPNAQASNIMDFTLSGVDGRKLPIASLKGKTVVFDFWATWCAPCREQHPLYEQVMQRYHNSQDVVFLFIATDDDRGLVAPFLKESHWDASHVYFEDGLSRVLQIANIPTTIVMDKKGEVISRMNGYVPSRFVDMLSDRIQDALKN